jgi:LemA protein
MKRKWIIIIVIVVLVAIWATSTYNGLVSRDEGVSSQWAQVENVYQRRLDLIPNLVKTVQGYANFEKSTLTQVIEARSKATQMTISPKNLNEQSLQQFEQAQGNLSSALARLMVVVERYPELKANQNFLELQAQLEGTENRIAVERRSFNEVAKSYNVYLRRFPKNLIASSFGFEKKAYFKAETTAEKAPVVNFN